MRSNAARVAAGTIVVAVAATAAAALSTSPAPFVAPTGCAYGGGGALPDARCTPGATNPAVTQKTIKTTICTSGYTATVRPTEPVTEAEKRKAVPGYGWPKGTSLTNFEYDHLIPLELGGAANSPKNLFPEQHSVNVGGLDEGSLVKDGLENKLAAIVCSTHPLLTLRQAQRAIATNWVLAYERWMGWSSAKPSVAPAPVAMPSVSPPPPAPVAG